MVFLSTFLPYILIGMAVYSLSERRRIDQKWYAWVPVLRYRNIGSLADQYQYMVYGKYTKKRKYLMVWSAGELFCLLGLIITIIVYCKLYPEYNYDFAADRSVSPLFYLFFIAFAVIFAIARIARYILLYMSLYDIYRSCSQKNIVQYMVLSVLFSMLGICIILFNLRYHDDGYAVLIRTEDNAGEE